MVIGDSSRGDNEPAAVLLTAEVGDDTPTTETFDEGKTAKKESTISFFFFFSRLVFTSSRDRRFLSFFATSRNYFVITRSLCGARRDESVELCVKTEMCDISLNDNKSCPASKIHSFFNGYRGGVVFYIYCYTNCGVEMNRGTASHEPIELTKNLDETRFPRPFSSSCLLLTRMFLPSFLSFFPSFSTQEQTKQSGWNVIDAFEVSLPRPDFEWVECRGCTQLSPTPSPPSPVSAVPIAGRTSFCFLEKIKIPPA